MGQLVTLREKGEATKTLLTRHAEELQKVLPKHITSDRFIRVALTACTNMPKLLDARKGDFMIAIMEAAALGLEPGIMGQCWLLPYEMKKGTAQAYTTVNLIVGYRGMIQLARRSGQIDQWVAGSIRENDEFSFVDVPPEMYFKRLQKEAERGERIAAYSCVKLFGGGWQPFVMYADEVNKRKAKSASAGSKYSPWVLWPDEMWAKTAVRGQSKFMPLSVEARPLSRVAEIDYRADLGQPQFSDSEFADYEELNKEDEQKEKPSQDEGDKKEKG